MARARTAGTHDRTRIHGMRTALLAWFAANQRDLPWRREPSPYAVWVSEVMLQQTRVAVVVERYLAFLERFPTVVALALATEQEVLALWSGLGYYRRARMLHKAAQAVAEQFDGNLPRTAAELRQLPGIGRYTGAAIASIAHGEVVAVVDGNVERVICRLAGWDAPARSGAAARRRQIEDRAAELLQPAAPGDWNQAMMELGALVCTPRSPACLTCPLRPWCATQGEHKAAPRAAMLSREVAHGLAVREGRKAVREVLLEQRAPTETVMPGLWQLPQLQQTEVPEAELAMAVRHAIMQVNYYVRIRWIEENAVDRLTLAAGTRRWVPQRDLDSVALTGLARKVLTRARLMPANLRAALRRRAGEP